MKISVVIPAYNEEKFLPRLLQSLKEQTIKIPFEIIVVNNNSTDRTVEVAQSFGAKVVTESKQGYAATCNRGFRCAKGEMIARADSDHVVPKNWLQTIWNEFEKDKSLIAIGGPIYPLESHFWENLLYYPGAVLGTFFLKSIGRGFPFPNMAVRSETFVTSGGFNTKIQFGEDTDFCLRLMKLGKVKLSLKSYCYTSTRRIRSLGFFRFIVGYCFRNQWAQIRGKKATIGLDIVRELPSQPILPQQPWMYFASSFLVFLIFITSSVMLLFSSLNISNNQTLSQSLAVPYKNYGKVFYSKIIEPIKETSILRDIRNLKPYESRRIYNLTTGFITT